MSKAKEDFVCSVIWLVCAIASLTLQVALHHPYFAGAWSVLFVVFLINTAKTWRKWRTVKNWPPIR